MKKSYIIQNCEQSDYQNVADIYNQYILQNGYTMETNLKTKADIQQWIEQFNEREKLYVLKLEDLVIGWGIIKKYSDREGYRHTCETAVYIETKQVGKGYGTFLKKHLIKICKTLEYRHLTAKIWTSNTTSIAYNQKLGYEIVGVQRKVGFKNGKWIDVMLMQYVID